MFNGPHFASRGNELTLRPGVGCKGRRERVLVSGGDRVTGWRGEWREEEAEGVAEWLVTLTDSLSFPFRVLFKGH